MFITPPCKWPLINSKLQFPQQPDPEFGYLFPLASSTNCSVQQWSVKGEFFCAKPSPADRVPAPGYPLLSSQWAALLATRTDLWQQEQWLHRVQSQAGDLLIWNLVLLGTTGIQIILWLNLELLNRQESVSAPWKREFFHKDGTTIRSVIFFDCYSSYTHMLVQHTHGSYSSWLSSFSFPHDESVTSESACGQSYMRQSQQETKWGKEDCIWQSCLNKLLIFLEYQGTCL